MIATIISSGSIGNCLVLTSSSGKSIILDAGVNFKRIQECLEFDYSGVEGVYISHSDGDHKKAALKCAEAGMPVYMSNTTKKECELDHHNILNIENGIQVKTGEFKIMAFSVDHDKECLGFMGHHPESGSFVYITDTYIVKNKFPKLNHYFIEANHDLEIMDERFEDGKIHGALRSRIIKAHLSIDNCLDVLRANDLSSTRTITLIHLSETNSNAAEFKRRVEDLTNKEVYIATPGLTLNLNKRPW